MGTQNFSTQIKSSILEDYILSYYFNICNSADVSNILNQAAINESIIIWGVWTLKHRLRFQT